MSNFVVPAKSLPRTRSGAGTHGGECKAAYPESIQ
jgi:hypothetical protein